MHFESDADTETHSFVRVFPLLTGPGPVKENKKILASGSLNFVKLKKLDSAGSGLEKLCLGHSLERAYGFRKSPCSYMGHMFCKYYHDSTII